jgi:transposase
MESTITLRVRRQQLETGGTIIMNQITHFCGIDVAKHSFSVAIKNGNCMVEEKTFEMDAEGFKGLESIIQSFQQQLLIGMEFTGIYHTNLFHFLRKRGYNTKVVNPYRVFQFFKFSSNKPTKTDRKDAKTICDYLAFEHKNRDKISKEKHDERETLRYVIREKESITSEIAKTKTEIKRIVCVVFPEIERRASIFSKRMLCLLLKFPSAASIRASSAKQFMHTVKQSSPTSKGRHTDMSPELIYELAEKSIADCYPLYEALLKMKITRLFSLLEERETITTFIDKIADKLFAREIQILTSIPGIGRESAICFMAEIKDIKRFPHWKNLIGFCGLDPVIKQSGRYNGKFRISKRGNSHARRIVWITANGAKRCCPYFREYYLKKRTEGKSYKEAVIATSTKLLRAVYTVLQETRLFK